MFATPRAVSSLCMYTLLPHPTLLSVHLSGPIEAEKRSACCMIEQATEILKEQKTPRCASSSQHALRSP